MEPNQMTSKAYFKALTIMYFALIAGLVFFGIVALFLVQSGQISDTGDELRNIFLFVAPLFLVGGVFGSTIMFKKGLVEAKNKTELLEKLNFYRSALIVRYALLEGPAFFTTVVYLITGDLLFLGMTALIIVIFLIINPSPEKAINDLELSYEEKQVLNDEEGILG
ncbi:MAG TPA: hypothetical protein VIN10_01860 [Bacteroidales bacterium]